MKRILYAVLIWLMFVGVGFSATYYMRSDGTAANKAAATGCGAANTAMNEAVHNAETFSGLDVINLCDDGGVYNARITPPSSGTLGNVITYQKATGDTPTLTNASAYALYLNAKSYIVVDGLTFGGLAGSRSQIFLYNGANYNEIKNCTFADNIEVAIYLRIDCHYNYIHDNTFNAAWPLIGPDDGLNDIIYLYQSDKNRIIDNDFDEGGNHAFVFGIDSNYNVVRGNTITMSRAYLDTLGENADKMSISEVFLFERSSYDLIEDNTVTFTGTPLTSNDSEQAIFQIVRGIGHVFRHNIYNNVKGIIAVWNNQATNNEYNMFYNNTFYSVANFANEGYALWKLEANIAGSYTRYNQFVNNIAHTVTNSGVRFNYDSGDGTVTDNLFRTNLMYNNTATNKVYIDASPDRYYTTYAAADAAEADFSGTITTEPTFADLVDFVADDGEAPQVDTGAWLTTVDGGTTSTTFTVDDYPYMFYWGYGITGEVGDTIKTENGQTGVIESINHGAKQITMSAAITVVDGEGIALDYSGDAPDIGAEEYSATATLSGFYPANGVGSVPVTADLTWTNGAGITDVHAYFDDTDCTTAVVDGDIETYEIPGDMALSDVFYWKLVANPDAENITYPPTGCYTFTTTSGPPVTAANKGDMIWNINAGDTKFNINAGDTKF